MATRPQVPIFIDEPASDHQTSVGGSDHTAPTEAAAMERFLEFAEAWGQRYPAIVRLWENAWA
jgi:hypothetical protein